MSRTNHHRRNVKRWNIVRRKADYPRPWSPYPGVIVECDESVGMETWDLRFYAGCRRTPQPVHRVLDFHGRYPSRFYYGADGVAKSYAGIRESELRMQVRLYTAQARELWNAGGDVDGLREPDVRPRSIEYDLW